MNFTGQNNFNANNNGNTNLISVNTRLYSSYSDNCHLTISGWNDKLTFKFAPFKGNDANGYRTYAEDKNSSVSIGLTMDNTSTLLAGINDKLIPAIKNNEQSSVSVTTGAEGTKKIMTVSYDGEKIIITAFVNVGTDNTVQEGNYINHVLNTREYITNYNPSTGEGEVITVQSDFENIVKALNTVYDFMGGDYHSDKFHSRLKDVYATNRSNFYQRNEGRMEPQYSAQNVNNASMEDFVPFA